jgi:hypothetical protein
MTLGKKELREALKLGIKTLILQEIRLSGLERTIAPHFIVQAMTQSIRETKERIAKLAEPIAQKEQAPLLKRMIHKAVDEEIDRAIELRNVKCIRCLHGRFYDEIGRGHETLPIGGSLAAKIGCDRVQPSSRKACKRFVEHSTAATLEDHLNEITLLYQYRELIDRMDEIWDYLTPHPTLSPQGRGKG